MRVTPNASKSEIIGMDEEGVLRIRLQAPPVEGKANKELVKFLAGVLGIKKKEISILSGEKSRIKTIEILGGGAGILEKIKLER